MKPVIAGVFGVLSTLLLLACILLLLYSMSGQAKLGENGGGKMKIGDRVEIVEQINGDDTPIGTRGVIVDKQDVEPNATYTVRLDGYPDDPENLYYTDGSNLAELA
jgi:hypothetical protein